MKVSIACDTEEYTDKQIQVYEALQAAALRIGENNWRAGRAAWVKAGRKAHTYRYQPTEGHRKVIDAMSPMLAGDISPESAMAILHEYDVFNERMGQANGK